MKIAVIIVRTLIGLLFLFASVTFFLNLVEDPEMTGQQKVFFDGLVASGYILPLSKTFELLCGLAFVTGRYVTLAIVVIFPIAVNILFINIFVINEGLPIAIPLFIGILFLAYAHRENYKTLFNAKSF